MKKIIAILTTAVLASALITGCSGECRTDIIKLITRHKLISASNSINRRFDTEVEKVIGYLSEAYMEDNKNIKVTYNPTGWGSGIQAVGEGRCDIGLSSRDLKD